jgi:hypothetical protein
MDHISGRVSQNSFNNERGITFGIFSEFLFPHNNDASLGNTSRCNRQGNDRDNDDGCNSAYNNDSDNMVKQPLHRPGEALRAPGS